MTDLYVPSTIDSTGVTDVSQHLAAWINNHASAGFTLRTAAGQTFRCDWLDPITASNVTFWMDPASKIVTADQALHNRTRSMWRQYGDRFDLDLVIHGAMPYTPGVRPVYNSAVEAQHAVEIGGGCGGTVKVKSRGVWGDGVYVGSVLNGAWVAAKPVTIIPDIAYCGRMLWSAVWAESVTIQGGYMHYCGRSAGDIEPNATPANQAWQVDAVDWDGTDVGDYTNVLLADDGSGTVTNVTVQNLKSNCPLTVNVLPSSPSKRANFKILNNTSSAAGYGSPNPIFWLSGVDGVTITGNVEQAVLYGPEPGRVGLSEAAQEQALIALGCTNVTVTGNTF